jgi:hypothetical protein
MQVNGDYRTSQLHPPSYPQLESGLWKKKISKPIPKSARAIKKQNEINILQNDPQTPGSERSPHAPVTLSL